MTTLDKLQRRKCTHHDHGVTWWKHTAKIRLGKRHRSRLSGKTGHTSTRAVLHVCETPPGASSKTRVSKIFNRTCTCKQQQRQTCTIHDIGSARRGQQLSSFDLPHLQVHLGLGQLHALDQVRHFAHVLEVDPQVRPAGLCGCRRSDMTQGQHTRRVTAGGRERGRERESDNSGQIAYSSNTWSAYIDILFAVGRPDKNRRPIGSVFPCPVRFGRSRPWCRSTFRCANS